MKRSWIAGLLTLALALGIAVSSAQAAVTIQFTFWGSADYQAAMNTLIAQFEKENPGINVEPIVIPSKYYDKLMTMIAGGTAPDVAMLAFDRVPEYVDAGAIQPIDPFVQASGYPIKDLFPVVVRAFTRGGKLYGLPRSFSPFVLFYNSDLAAARGVVPSDNWKWGDLLAAAKKLTPRPGFAPWGFAANFEADGTLYPEWFFPWIWQNQGEVVDVANRRSALLSQPTREAMDFYIGMIQDSKVAPNSVQAQTYGGSDSLFLSRNGAMIVEAYNMALSARTQENFRFDVARLPYQKERATVAFPIGYVMPAQAKHPNEAFKLMQFLGGPQAQKIVPQLGLGMPGLRSIAESDLFLQPGKMPAHSRVFLQDAEIAQPLPSDLPKFQEWYKAWTQEMAGALAGTESLEKALARADAAINRILSTK
ncbi:MAG: sugar ABC transporter substrate-binding protein [Limnochordaceae bacterium]|nr:sugar ABC transporter substrate-binding protein [Limnochordaceae bacterium]